MTVSLIIGIVTFFAMVLCITELIKELDSKVKMVSLLISSHLDNTNLTNAGQEPFVCDKRSGYDVRHISFLDEVSDVALLEDDLRITLHEDWFGDGKYYSELEKEVEGGRGYIKGGKLLKNRIVDNIVAESDSIVVKSDSIVWVWANTSVSCKYAVIYKDTGTASTSPIIGYIDFGNYIGTYRSFTIEPISWEINKKNKKKYGIK